MTFKAMTGTLNMLGASHTESSRTNANWIYSIIELDGKPVLFKTTIGPVLRNYLESNVGQRVTLYIKDNEIEAIRLESSGVVYLTACDPIKEAEGRIANWIIAILLIPVFGLGLLAMLEIPKLKKWWRAFVDQNPDPAKYSVLK